MLEEQALLFIAVKLAKIIFLYSDSKSKIIIQYEGEIICNCWFKQSQIGTAIHQLSQLIHIWSTVREQRRIAIQPPTDIWLFRKSIKKFSNNPIFFFLISH